MAEDEIIKHAKKAMDVMHSKEHSFWDKVKEIGTEIFIIVFAVSLSIWFHNRSEHLHEQEQVKEFLLGLRDDLLSDLNEIKGDKAFLASERKVYIYVAKTKIIDPLQVDSVIIGGENVYSGTFFEAHNGRFEGFKASGKIGNIEDPKLQNDIMDLYQANIPDLLSSENFYSAQKNKLVVYIEKNEKRLTDSTSNMLTILKSDEARNICRAIDPSEILSRYDICAKKIQEIISEIEEAYHIKPAKEGAGG